MKPDVRLAYCTTREAADLLGISLRTAQLWVDSGILEAWRTEGGHRRIKLESVNRLRHLGSPAPATPAPPAAPEPDSHPLRILIAEDDNVLMRLYKMRIESWGLPVEVITAANGYDALLLIGRHSPDLMITDLGMPSIDGARMLRSLTASSYREGMEIIVVTGLDDAQVAARGPLPDSIRVLRKPVPFVALREAVERLLARRDALTSTVRSEP